WHDGGERQPADEFIPSYRFLPLAESLRERAGMKEQVRSLPAVQRVWFDVFAGHRTGWLTVLTNGSGDGYFYDQARRRSSGSFFFSMHDEHWYLFFPTLADFVGAVLECFESGAFRTSRGGRPLRWDIEK